MNGAAFLGHAKGVDASELTNHFCRCHGCSNPKISRRTTGRKQSSRAKRDAGPLRQILPATWGFAARPSINLASFGDGAELRFCHNAADASGDLNGDGYTNIEDLINGLDPQAKKTDWTDLRNNVDAPNKTN